MADEKNEPQVIAPEAGAENEFVLDAAVLLGKEEPNEPPAGDPPPAVVVKADYSRFKELDEEVDDEEKVFTKFKGLKEENQKLKLIAESSDAIDKDERIVSWKHWAKKPNEEVAYGHFLNQYMEGGLSKEDAQAKAQGRINTLKEKNPDAIDDMAFDIKADLNKAIQNRTKEITDKVSEARKQFEFKPADNKLIEKAEQTLSKTDTFLNLKIGGNKEGLKQMQDEASQFMKSGELNKQLQDPETLAQVAMFLKYRPQWAKAISARNNGKQKVIDKLPATPPASRPKTVNVPTKKPSADGKKYIDPKGF